MLTHNTYFDAKVQSVGFERNGLKASVGVIDVGEFRFGTGAAERMTVISGELYAKLPGESDFRPFPAGTSFEVPAKSGFDVKASAPAAYLCEYLGA
jgi:purine/pyrimidine-nucleoside phosphorylase